jgi:hypothetical protein
MACLEWLVLDLLLLDIQRPPPPLHTRRSILSPEKATTHNKHSCIHDSHPRHATHNSIIEYQKQTCSDIWINNYLYKRINHSNNSKQFIIAIKPYSQANNLQASMWIKTWHPGYFQIASTITEPIQLLSNQRSIWLNYNEFPNLT